jgi:hypothetical protein
MFSIVPTQSAAQTPLGVPVIQAALAATTMRKSSPPPRARAMGRWNGICSSVSTERSTPISMITNRKRVITAPA